MFGVRVSRSKAGLAWLLLVCGLTCAWIAGAQNSSPTPQSSPSKPSSSNAPSQPQSSHAQPSQSQTAPPPDGEGSLAAAARDAKAKKTARATKVFTDDDMDEMAGPLPRLKLQGGDNSDEVIAAIKKYRTTHTVEETEQVLHGWYDRYAQMLIAAYDENARVMSLRSVNQSNSFDLCRESEDQRQCQAQRNETNGIRTDSTEMMKNNDLAGRLMQALLKIRSGLEIVNLRYDWFKIRVNNGTDI